MVCNVRQAHVGEGMKLVDLFKAVQERNLSKDKLEEYRDDLSNLYALMQLELAEIRKAKALHIFESAEKTIAAKEAAWAASEKGQREIELAHYIKGTEKILSSLKSRLYQVY